MPEKLTQPRSEQPGRWQLEDFFIAAGFYDLLPLAMQIAKDLGYDRNEMTNAVCKVGDKFLQYPPTKNRTAWFKKVFAEKLAEARGDMLSFKATVQRTHHNVRGIDRRTDGQTE